MSMRNNEICVFSNDFIDRRPQMTRFESQLFYIALSKINPQIPKSSQYDKSFCTVTLPCLEVLEKLGKKEDLSSRSNHIKRLSKSCDSLKKNNMFSKIDFNRKDGFVFEFSQEMTPYLLNLSSKPFSQLLLSEICQLKKSSAIRLLEICTVFSYSNKGKKTIKTIISTEDLKKEMYLNENYRNNNLKLFLKKAIDEINSSTSYKIVCEEEREDKRIINLSFYVTMPDELVFGKKVSINKTRMKEKTVDTAPAEPTATTEDIDENTSPSVDVEWLDDNELQKHKEHNEKDHNENVNITIDQEEESKINPYVQPSEQIRERASKIGGLAGAILNNAIENSSDETRKENEVIIEKLMKHGISKTAIEDRLMEDRERVIWAMNETDRHKPRDYCAYFVYVYSQTGSYVVYRERAVEEAKKKAEIKREQQKIQDIIDRNDEEYKKKFDINFIYNDMGKGELLDKQREYMQRLDDDVKRGRQAGDKFYDTHVKHLKVINARLEAL